MLAKWLDSRVRTSWHQKTLTMALTFSLLIVGPVSADPVEDPEIVTQNGQEVLLLPDSLQTLISEQFPGFRVPDITDVKGLWVRIRVPGTFPFIVTSDFNDDGLKDDVALILLSDSEFKIVIFNKTANGYMVAFESGNKLGQEIAGTPFYQRLLLSVVVKGKDLQVGPSQFHADHDTVMVAIFEEAVTVIFWNGQTYEGLPLGSSL